MREKTHIKNFYQNNTYISQIHYIYYDLML